MAGIFFRLLLKAMTPVIMLIGMMMYMQSGDPMVSLKDTISSFTDNVSYAAQKSVKDISTPMLGDDLQKTASTQRIYRWTDKNGGIHFGTTRPTDDLQVKSMDINPNANIIDSYQKAPEQQNQTQTSQISPQGLTANPMKIKQILDQAQRSNQARLKQLEEIN